MVDVTVLIPAAAIGCGILAVALYGPRSGWSEEANFLYLSFILAVGPVSLGWWVIQRGARKWRHGGDV